MSIPGAWIIAPKGVGTEADAAAIERLVIDAAPKWERVRPYQRDIIEFFRRPWDGPRLIWVVGIACDDPMGDKCLRTDDASDGLPLANLGRLLLEAADATRHPIVAILDVCHARYARPPQAPKHENLAVIYACDEDELTPADDRGGWLTQTLVDGLTTLPGAINLHALLGFVAQQRRDQQKGGHWPNADLGRLADEVLHTRLALSGPRAAGPAPSDPAPTDPPPADPLATCRDWLHGRFSHFRTVLGTPVGQEVYVELAVDAENRHESMHLPRRGSLEVFLEQRPGARFAVLGEPGSGKSTMARHLAWSQSAAPGGPLVLCLNAGELASGHPFDLTAKELGNARTQQAAAGLVDALRRAAEAGEVWLLLDGLDEVAVADAERVRQTIADLASNLPQMAVVVLSRAIGYGPLPGFQALTVLPLDRDRQVELLARNQVPEPEATLTRIEAIDALRLLAGVPVLLSFIALVARERPDLPRSRAEVYAGALKHYFTRGRVDTPPLKDPKAAQHVLAHLAVALQALGGNAWPEDTLVDLLEDLERGQIPEGVPEIFKQIHAFPKARLATRRAYDGENPRAFLKRVAQATGLIGPYDGEGKPWKFLHKTLHDALCAQVLAGCDEAHLVALVQTLAPDKALLARWSKDQRDNIARFFGDQVDVVPDPEFLVAARRWADEAWLRAQRLPPGQVDTIARFFQPVCALPDEELLALVRAVANKGALARWAEPLAQAVAQRPAPLALLRAIGQASEPLLLRCAPEANGVAPPALLALVTATEAWSGEDLLALARRWRDEPEGLAAIRALLNPLKPKENYEDLETAARVHYALSEVRALGDEAAFFHGAHLPPPNPKAIVAWVPVPPEGVPPTFRMGSAEGVGYADEHPAHDVTLTPFELGQYQVTKEEFARLAPGHECPGGPRHPVTMVSWYVARLFAHWAGGRLPREAEWEYACRAGNPGRWCFGDDEEKLKDYAWFADNAEELTWPVGLKAANEFKLHDMHGNVWEWCGDWFGDYPSAPQHDPEGPAGGVDRVLRGGAGWGDAAWCRSACRLGNHPALRLVGVGFRVLRPPVGS